MNVVRDRESTGGRKWGKRILIPVAIVLLLVVGGPFVYINFIAEDAPDPFTLPTPDSTVQGAAGTGSGSGSATELDGTWTVVGGSQAGYRVKEVLFGQDNDAVGRTSDVSGEFTVDGTTVQAATVTVDMASISSDESRRDNQFHGRIMATSTFPTATFTLSEPITVPSVPAENAESNVRANGQLTMRGVTRPVVADLEARRTVGNIEVAGSIPIRFADWGIPSPSVGGISTREEGVVEFLLIFAKE